MDVQVHVECPINLATIQMGRDKAKQAVKTRHGGEDGGGRLFRCEGTGGGEDAGVDTPPIVEEVAYGYL
jgi:hypothetical protein